MKNILFICPTQYGYNTDYYQYCENLSIDYNVYYVGIELNKEYRFENNSRVNVLHVDPKKYLIGTISLFMTVLKLSKKVRMDYVIVYYLFSCSLYNLIFGRSKTIVDIRTAFLGNSICAKSSNSILSFETNFFLHISVISQGLVDFLNLNRKKCRILPLGSKDGVRTKRQLFPIKLLYVGTFNDRNIDITIKGVDQYISATGDRSIMYYICGLGEPKEINKVKEAINKCVNSNNFIYMGEVRGKELVKLYKICNIGVSYVPLRDYYDKQPPTKTYEYLLNSMAVIATPTSENLKVVDATNGVIMNGEDVCDFRDALINISKNEYDFVSIYDNNLCYIWSQITKSYLKPILSQINHG